MPKTRNPYLAVFLGTLCLMGALAFGLQMQGWRFPWIETAQGATCGNGEIETGEACDDGNTSAGDGCSATCTVEAGYSCTEGCPGAAIVDPTTNKMRIVWLDATHVLAVYEDAGTTNIQAVVGTVSGDSITFATPNAVGDSNTATAGIQAVKVDTDTVVVLFLDEAQLFLYLETLTISGNTVTASSPASTEAFGWKFLALEALSTTKVVALYTDSGNNLWSVIADIQPDKSIVLGTPAQLGLGSATAADLAVYSPTQFVVMERGAINADTVSACTGNVSGNAITYGTAVSLNGRISSVSVAIESGYIAFVDYTTEDVVSRIATVSGTDITLNPAQFLTGPSNPSHLHIRPISGNASYGYVLSWYDTVAQSAHSALCSRIAGDTQLDCASSNSDVTYSLTDTVAAGIAEPDVYGSNDFVFAHSEGPSAWYVVLGNADPVRYCRSVCTAPSTCGNGAIEGDEGCDDSNVTAGDGCSALCAEEAGYSCNREPSVCIPTPWLSDWNYRKEMIVDETNVDSALTDFPLLVAFSADADIAAHTQDDGDDIRFTSNTGVLLSYEREDYHESGGSGAGLFWVKVPKVTSVTDTAIYLYYGKSDASDGQNVTDVWSNSYVAVWHMDDNPEGPAPQILDSTSSDHDGTCEGAMTSTNLVAGTVGSALSFDGSNDDIDTNAIITDTLVNDYTYSFWAKTGATQQTYADIFGNHTDVNGILMQQNTGNTNQYYTSGFPENATFTLTAGTWQHVAYTKSSTVSNKVYLDAALATEYTSTNPLSAISYNLRIAQGWGAVPWQRQWNGSLDEFRISSAVRSADWIKFEYYNMGSAAHELSFGAQESGATCGNGSIEGAEGCDDGNVTAGDGCSALCAVETGYSCVGEPSVCAVTCGDGLIMGSEACDDDNVTADDGCSATCTLESGFTCAGTPSSCVTDCGDSIVAGAEECDPPGTATCTDMCLFRTAGGGGGTAATGDTAAPKQDTGAAAVGPASPAKPVILCGNGILDPLEECDEGNLNELLSCSNKCKRLFCGDGEISYKIGEECEPESYTEYGETMYRPLPSCSSDPQATYCPPPGSSYTECVLARLPACEADGGEKGMEIPFATLDEQAFCGNGRKDEAEQCDFGGLCVGGRYDGALWRDRSAALLCRGQGGMTVSRSGDGCAAQCRFEFCGDGFLLSDEQCDNGSVCADDRSRACRTSADCDGGACLYHTEANPACTQSCMLCAGRYGASIDLSSLAEGDHTVKVKVANPCGVSTLAEAHFSLTIGISAISREGEPVPGLAVRPAKNLSASADGTQPFKVSMTADKKKYAKGMDTQARVTLIVTDADGHYVPGLTPDSFVLALDGRRAEGVKVTETQSIDCTNAASSVRLKRQYLCSPSAP